MPKVPKIIGMSSSKYPTELFGDVDVELLPCPFCGSSDIGYSYIETYSLGSSYGTLGCNSCGCNFPTQHDDAVSDDEIRRWNTRINT